MIADWIIALVVSAVLQVVAYVLTPKPKAPRPDAVRDIQGPTAETGRPIPVVVGTVRVRSPNILWEGDRSTNRYQIKV